MGCKDVKWIGLAEDRGKWLGVTKTETKVWVL
jgi:hypothetical protein